MDKTGLFILGVMVLGIIWSVIKTSLYHLAGDSIVVNVLMAIFKEVL